MSNTSIGRAEKGSKFWIQKLVTFENGSALTKAIQQKDSSVTNIDWLSPIPNNDPSQNYKEFKTYQIPGVIKSMLTFWPDNGPWWDGVGLNGNQIILVEAKAHIQETFSKCKATSGVSIDKIKKELIDTHQRMAPNHVYSEDIWYDTYYQMANRLTFLSRLGTAMDVKLVLLNIAEDPTHISTSNAEWEKHYEEVFLKMIGTKTPPSDVIIVNFEV